MGPFGSSVAFYRCIDVVSKHRFVLRRLRSSILDADAISRYDTSFESIRYPTLARRVGSNLSYEKRLCVIVSTLLFYLTSACATRAQAMLSIFLGVVSAGLIMSCLTLAGKAGALLATAVLAVFCVSSILGGKSAGNKASDFSSK